MTVALPLSIESDHPAFAGHFPGRPIVPGVMLLDLCLRSILTRSGNEVRWSIDNAKFLSPVAPGDAQHNALFTVSILGTANRTVVTMDGGNVSNNITVGGGTTSMNFSQEMIQEFQLSTVNFDLATPISIGGAVNVVTRSGHGKTKSLR